MEKTLMFETPILFIIFNRPDTTQQVFDAIRKIKPKQLFVAADGPRINKIGEKEKCEEARSIINKIDWDCETKTLFRDTNLGCKRAVSSAISWFFENVEEGIILEDDCLPDIAFFTFCSVLLEKYRNDTRVMMISGDNFLFDKHTIDFSYYFSKYHFIWGWATWKRAWQLYDLNMNNWLAVKKSNLLKNVFDMNQELKYWTKIMNKVYSGQIDTWDYQWGLSMWVQNGLTICPQKNLIKNIGFRADATHTKDDNYLGTMNTYSLSLPIDHPPMVIQNKIADKICFKTFFGQTGFIEKILNKISKKVLKN